MKFVGAPESISARAKDPLISTNVSKGVSSWTEDRIFKAAVLLVLIGGAGRSDGTAGGG